MCAAIDSIRSIPFFSSPFLSLSHSSLCWFVLLISIMVVVESKENKYIERERNEKERKKE